MKTGKREKTVLKTMIGANGLYTGVSLEEVGSADFEKHNGTPDLRFSRSTNKKVH